MNYVSAMEACELLSAQTGGCLPAAVNEGFWHANASRTMLGVVIPENGFWRFALFERDDDSREYRCIVSPSDCRSLKAAEQALLDAAQSPQMRMT